MMRAPSYRTSTLIAALGLVAGLGLGNRAAHASLITYSPVQTLSGNTDVDTTGSLDRAFAFGNAGVPSETVNGVTFNPFAVTGGTTFTSGSTTLTGGALSGANGAFGSANPPFSTLGGASYQALLSSAAFTTDQSAMNLQLNGLTNGQTYHFQVFVNDSRGPSAAPARNEGLSDGVANPTATNLQYNTTQSDGGVGQYVIGQFTASGVSQTITFTPFDPGFNPAAQINAFQLRLGAAPTPEPATCAMMAVGLLFLAVSLRRKKRQAESLGQQSPSFPACA